MGTQIDPMIAPKTCGELGIRYWKTPAAEEESIKGKERRSKGRTPSKTGRKRSSDAYDDEVKTQIRSRGFKNHENAVHVIVVLSP